MGYVNISQDKLDLFGEDVSISARVDQVGVIFPIESNWHNPMAMNWDDKKHQNEMLGL